MATVLSCFNCHCRLSFADSVPFKETCEKCDADVHCCKNCKFFDLSAYNSCKEPQAERVLDKERANLCDYFKAKSGEGTAKVTDSNNIKSSAFNKLDDLFKK